MVDVAERVRRLREKQGLTQAEVAARAGLDRVEVNQIERGKNSCSSWRIRAGLARAFRVQIPTMAAYLDEEIDLDTVVARAAAHESDGTLRPVRLLQDRPDWREALDAARGAASVTDPDLTVADWDRVAQLYDGPSVPRALSPRLILQLARALRSG